MLWRRASAAVPKEPGPAVWLVVGAARARRACPLERRSRGYDRASWVAFWTNGDTDEALDKMYACTSAVKASSGYCAASAVKARCVIPAWRSSEEPPLPVMMPWLRDMMLDAIHVEFLL